MPEYLSPGVYIEEISTKAKPIEGVGTSTAGFVGETERGPQRAKLVTSWLDFQRWYGDVLPMPNGSHLPYAVEGFFSNGGKRCFIARVASNDAVAAGRIIDTLQFSAVGNGTWGNRVLIRIKEGTKHTAAKPKFRVSIVYYRELPDLGTFVDPLDGDEVTNPARREPDAVEDYDNLTHVEGASNNVVEVINAASRLVRCWWTGGGAARPGDVEFKDTPLENGSDGAAVPDLDDYEGEEGPIHPTAPDDLLGRDTGLLALSRVDEVAILAAPDEVRITGLRAKVIEQCELLKDRFAVCSADRGETNLVGLNPPQDTTFAAFYYPWIQIYDAANSSLQIIPATGHIVGVYARTDIERGVHKAPANAVLRGARNMEFAVPKGKQDILNPKGVNCIRDFRSDGRGIRVWGARTMSSDPEWRYVSVRRLFLFVEESIEEGTQWVVFEPNHEPTWAKVTRSITNFLIRVWRSGGLQGVTQDEAFFVKCDRTTMTQDDIDNGRLICYIGIAPVKPAEFVIFRISQKTAEAQS